MRKLFAVGSSPHKWHGRLQLSADEEEHHVGSAKNSGTGLTTGSGSIEVEMDKLLATLKLTGTPDKTSSERTMIAEVNCPSDFHEG